MNHVDNQENLTKCRKLCEKNEQFDILDTLIGFHTIFDKFLDKLLCVWERK